MLPDLQVRRALLDRQVQQALPPTSPDLPVLPVRRVLPLPSLGQRVRQVPLVPLLLSQVPQGRPVLRVQQAPSQVPQVRLAPPVQRDLLEQRAPSRDPLVPLVLASPAPLVLPVPHPPSPVLPDPRVHKALPARSLVPQVLLVR